MDIGPRITHLALSPEYDPGVISAYIGSVLKQLNRTNAYGLLAGVTQGSNFAVPTLLFGFPPPAMEEINLPAAPYGLPILVRVDWIVLMSRFRDRWSLSRVRESTKITLEELSIGIEGSTETAGSFCGFLKRATTPETAFGLTAAHCMLGAVMASRVCCPSTLEITSRVERLLRYTTLCPVTDRLRTNQTKEVECRSLVTRYQFKEKVSGVELCDPGNPLRSKKGVLNGDPVGEIVAYYSGKEKDLLYRYDQRIQGLGLPGFGIPVGESWETRLDYCIFSCIPDRYGGNIYEGEVVTEIADLYPGVTVEKIGRTTGATEGYVNGYLLQHWSDYDSTHEISIIGDGLGFANAGDSGGCVLVRENGVCRAAGMLIGKNELNNFAVVTPLHMILNAATYFEWA